MSSLKIAEGLTLPLSAITERMAILGMSGAGKTNTATVLVEEVLKQKQTVCVVDPKGDFWGLQSSADGKREGFPILVMGGEKQNVELLPTAGVVVADMIVDRDVSVVLDLQNMSKGKAKRFVTDFLEQLYHRRRRPMHLVIDEADLFCPQKPESGDDARMLGAMQDIVARGRKRGIGSTLVTQRAARLNKDVLTQAQVLIAHGMIGEPDRKQISKWMDENGVEADGQVLVEVGRLETGHAFVWSPRLLKITEPKRVTVRVRDTFDSSATPEVGKKRREPTRLSKPDLARLTDAVKASAEQAKKDDPTALRVQIKALERKVMEAETHANELQIRAGLRDREQAKGPTKRVEVPVLSKRHERLIELAIERLESTSGHLRGEADAVEEIARKIVGDLNAVASQMRVAVNTARVHEEGPVTRPMTVSSAPDLHPVSLPQPIRERLGKPSKDAREGERLGAGAMAALSVLASFRGEVVSRARLGFLTGYSARKSTLRNIVSVLRVRGYIEDSGGGFRALQAGIELAGTVEPWPIDRRRAIERWRDYLPAGARMAFDVLVDCGGHPITREELATRTGHDPNVSTFRNLLSVLRTNGLAQTSGGKVQLVAELLE